MFTINSLYFHCHSFCLFSRKKWREKGEKQHSLLKAEGSSTDTDETASQKKQADTKIRQSAASSLYCYKRDVSLQNKLIALPAW